MILALTYPFNPAHILNCLTFRSQQKKLSASLKSLTPIRQQALIDQIKPIILQTLHKELAPILQVIFQRSINQGKLPNIWKDANVSLVFKKGDKSERSYYRPISPTCVLYANGETDRFNSIRL